MGCSSSKLDEEVAVKTCHDRKSFVKKAIAQRGLLASSHVAYVQSLRRVSMALFYYFAEDEHLYFLQEQSSSALCLHHPSSPEKKVLVINCLRPVGPPVHPVVEQWDPEAVETATIDRFFGLDHQFFIRPSSIDPVNENGMPISPQPARWDLSWDPFSSRIDDHHLYPDYGVEGIKAGQEQEDEQIPELEEESDDDSDGHDHSDGETEEEEEEEEEGKGEEADAAATAAEVARPAMEEERKVDHVKNELRVVASADVGEHGGTPGFTVYVARPRTSMAEAMKDIQGHFMKIVETASEVSVLLEVVPYRRRGTCLFFLCSGGRRRGARRSRGPAGAIRAVPEPQGEP